MALNEPCLDMGNARHFRDASGRPASREIGLQAWGRVVGCTEWGSIGCAGKVLEVGDTVVCPAGRNEMPNRALSGDGKARR
jgi:hypothetical protein